MARNLGPKEREARLAEIRRQNEADAKRARLLRAVAVGIVAVLVLAVVVVIALQARGGEEEVTYPGGTTLTTPDDPASGGVLVGQEGEVTLVVYEDYQCPFCRELEEESGEYLRELAEGADVSVVRRPVAILDRVSDGYSTRAVAAAGCVADTDPEAFDAWAAQVFTEQPSEGGSGLPDDRLVEIAAEAGVDIEQCVADGTFVPWAGATTEAAAAELDRLSTPTVLVDGERVEGADGVPTPEELQAAVDAALGDG
jgi:protein-disulfide isomerase